MDAYEAEKTIFDRLKKIGLAALKAYFASVGTGDAAGDSIETPEGHVLKKEATLRERDYYSVFGQTENPQNMLPQKRIAWDHAARRLG